MSLDNGREFIEHFGVKGMKWGVRRSQKQLDRASGRATNKKIKSERRQTVKNRRTLSDDEINKVVTRLQQEKKLKSLVAEDTRPGRTVTQAILSNSGKTIAGAVVTGAGMYALRAKMQGNWDWKEASAYLKPKK